MPHRLSGRQHSIMKALWARRSATVAEVQQDLDQPLAYTTVATLLGRLERRGLISHRTEGRTFIYEPAVSEDEVERSIVGDLLETVFGGSPTEMVSQLLASEYVDARELERIKKLIEQHDADRRREKGGRDAR